MFSKLQHKVSENVTTLLKGGWGGGRTFTVRSIKDCFSLSMLDFLSFLCVAAGILQNKKKKHTRTHAKQTSHGLSQLLHGIFG